MASSSTRTMVYQTKPADSEFKTKRDGPLYGAAKQPNSWPHDAVGKRLQGFMGDLTEEK